MLCLLHFVPRRNPQSLFAQKESKMPAKRVIANFAGHKYFDSFFIDFCVCSILFSWRHYLAAFLGGWFDFQGPLPLIRKGLGFNLPCRVQEGRNRQTVPENASLLFRSILSIPAKFPRLTKRLTLTTHIHMATNMPSNSRRILNEEFFFAGEDFLFVEEFFKK